MALTNAEKQKDYRDRERIKLRLLRQETARLRKEAAKPHDGDGNVTGKLRDLAVKLDPLFDSIFEMILRPTATYCAPTTALIMLERELVAAGIMPGSRRTNDAATYARELERKHKASLADLKPPPGSMAGGTLVMPGATPLPEQPTTVTLPPSGADGLRAKLKQILTEIEGRTDRPRSRELGELLHRAKKLVFDACGPAPTDKRRTNSWRRQREERWDQYCRETLRVAGGGRFGDGFIKWWRNNNVTKGR